MPTPVRLGFVPLVDCAIPVVALELGFARGEGLDLKLEREASWAAMRDKLAYGVLDAAHMLAGLPLAATLGIGGAPPVPMWAPMALGLGGNAITVSTALYQRMVEADPEAMRGPRSGSARALARVVRDHLAAGRPPLSFASVFPVSSHNYELRYWLASAGIDPDRDVNLGVVAPSRMVENLGMGWIDGYCVGEPWNLRAVQTGKGVVVATKADIWPNSPEKVLGLRASWAGDNAGTVAALVRALVRAAQWADDPGNRAELATMLAAGRYVGVPTGILRMALEGRPVLRPGAAPEHLPDLHVFYRWQATFPWTSHAVWLLTQMVRWGQLTPDVDFAAAAARVYRPDIYRAAVAPLGIDVPAEDTRV
ncbi:MAG TPA: CmpA/NrtA family ABC transporter substrate-binding protein, partial [Arenibaculum sp.]|nr:CmpA/NrtA family ABC transporter substrate-binding protein [Arenibaculum sp.]